jgi:chromosome segregation protein
MHLKRLEIHGFKSFADRTEVEFLPGITAVVGPNGSGKSNVSDALLWILGEQNARSLRGEGNVDLIFAGTEKRRPMGMAEVSLTIDNADRGLPTDFEEVTITRRVYRSGEGEFFINRTACRLKDIYELFLDTGVGRDAYSIIGQDKIHAALSARSEERRELLEEAAGIKKYRHRRKEAHRKLESTRQNLTRVDDILSELEGQVEPLEIQSRVAERWKELNEQLRALEVGLLAADYLRKSEELSRLLEEKEALHQNARTLSAQLARKEAEEQLSRQELARIDGALESVRRSRDEARERALKLEGKLALARQQSVADASERLRLVTDQTRLEARSEEWEKEAAEVERERSEAERLSRERQLQAREQEPFLAELERRRREATQQLERNRRRFSEESSRKATLAEKSRQAETQLSEGSDQAEERRSRLAALRSDAEDAAKREAEARSSREEAHARLAGFQEEAKALESEAAAAKQAHEAAQSALRERQTQLMRVSARHRSLSDMHRSLEGAFRGVKAVFQAARNGELNGEFRVVADLLTVPPEYGVAMETALGSHAQDIVTRRDHEAKAAIQYLKRKNAGRATFLPLDLIRGDRMRNETGIGVHGIASDLAQFEEEFRPAIESLLGRALIVEDMETAIQLVRTRGSRMGGRMVTLEGEPIHPGGSLTGGSREGNAGLLSRKLEIDRLAQEIVVEADRLKEEERTAQAASNAMESLQARRETLRGEIAAARVEVAQRDSALDHAGREARRLQRECEDAEKRLQTGLLRLEEARGQRHELSRLLEETDAVLEELRREESRLAERQEDVTGEWEAARDAAAEVQLELARTNERKRNVEVRIRSLERTRADLERERRGIAESLALLDERRSRSGGEEETLERGLEAGRSAVDALDARLVERSQERTLFLERMAERQESLKALASERNAAVEKLHKLEVKEAALLSDVEHLRFRLKEDYESEPEDAPMRAEAVVSRQNTATEVNRLKREMLSLGTVNLGAIEEFRRVSERVEFLRTQKTDLEEAEATLLRVVAEIDATTQEAFRATFDRVTVAFDRMFRRLFNGGRTQLVLTDPANILETGIDIIVQPPGKKLQRLQLLSGGEKALTAVALLFALLEVKPSPFCLLDEVDAALDEANVGRFADVVRDFAQRSQFILITHNKNTMAAANTLYGVTMEEPGISKILSVRLED